MIGGRESDIKIQAQTKEREMFGMSKNDGADDDRASTLAQQRLAGGESATLMLTDGTSTISSDMTIVGKITGDGTLRIFGRVEGSRHHGSDFCRRRRGGQSRGGGNNNRRPR